MKAIIVFLGLIFATAVSAKTCMPTENTSFREINNEKYISVNYSEPTPNTFKLSYVKLKHMDKVFGMVMNKALAGVEADFEGLVEATNGITIVYERQGNKLVCEQKPSEFNSSVSSVKDWLYEKKTELSGTSKRFAIETANFLLDYASNK